MVNAQANASTSARTFLKLQGKSQNIHLDQEFTEYPMFYELF